MCWQQHAATLCSSSSSRRLCLLVVVAVALHPSTVQEFKIQNIVGSCDVKFPIRLEGLCMAHGYFATVSQ